ncbi:c-type cytochrome [Ottowia sp.]|uniref:c-type cytochrome n=1 Tax=Ottowia sp. TaxID=1898956 RepID=UPI002616EAA8|nr:c-type cytochrome [Ottowia sp.]
MKILAPFLFALAALGAKAADQPLSQRVERGRYLVQVGGCADCHTPLKQDPNGPKPDLTRQLSGHPQTLKMPPSPALADGPWLVVSSATNTAWAGPWGVSFTANLTPDLDTGIGRWSERDFVETLRTSRHLGVGRPLLPPMPAAYGHMTEADLKAMFAYLRTIPPVRNQVPVPLLPLPR